jgi:hypothetical protein
MSAHANPDIIDDGLVFLYDTDDGKSYKGEPTTNLFPSPQLDNNTNTTVGEASITLKNFDSDLVGLEMIQAATSNIVSFSMGSLSSAVSGGTYTWSSYVNSTSIGHKVKAQVTVRVDGVRYWLTNSNTWTTSTTECRHLFAPTIANEWHRVDTQFTMPTGTLTDFQLGGWYRSTSNFTLRVANAQLELKSHATPFVDGTRSSTQGLLDRTGNSTIDISNASFDSNAQMTFDGTDDQLTVNNVGIDNYSEAFSYECVFKAEGTWANDRISNIVGIIGSYAGHYGLGKSGTNTISFVVRDANYNVVSGTVSDTSAYHHLVGVWDQSNSQIRLYIDGELKSSATVTKTGTPDSSHLRIGGRAAFGGSNGSYYHGDIPIVKYYKTALTTAEVLQNFNATKSRFGL